jgi:acyl-CoA synthetase (NDP forming)
VSERPTRAASGLDRLLLPRSVAVVGAGRRGLGRLVLDHLVAGGFRGELWAVNPGRARVGSTRCVPSVAALPSPPDLAVIAIGRDDAVAAVRDCAAAGCGAAIVVSAGFAETGRDGAAAQESMARAARAAGMRLLGPNCMGLVHTHPRLHAAFGFGPVRRGPLAFVSQSGSVADYVLYHSAEWGLGVSLVASVGNEADVSAGELVLAAARDRRARVVAVFVERRHRLDELAAALARASLAKPVVVLGGGRDPAISRMVRDAGAVRARSLEGLMAASVALARDPAGHDGSLAVLTNAGGPALLALDAAAAIGARVVEAGPVVAAACGRELPQTAICEGAVVDLTASAAPEHFGLAASALAGRASSLVCLIMSPEGTDPLPAVRAVSAAWRGPLAFCLLAAGRQVERARRAAAKAGLVATREPALAVEAACASTRWHRAHGSPMR